MEQPKSPDKGIRKGVSTTDIYNNDLVSIMQKHAPQFGVDVKILKKEGEEFTNDNINPITHEREKYTGIVHQDESFISINSGKGDLSDFWNAVKAEEASRKNSSNPPKI